MQRVCWLHIMKSVQSINFTLEPVRDNQLSLESHREMVLCCWLSVVLNWLIYFAITVQDSGL